MRSRPILVVDDDPTILSTIAELLDFEGYAVATASNGAEALEFIRHDSPAPRLVLLDMRMPIMDGWAFARAVAEGGHRLPIVVMTAAQDAPRWAKEVGARAHVSKPFEADELIATVESALAEPD